MGPRKKQDSRYMETIAEKGRPNRRRHFGFRHCCSLWYVHLFFITLRKMESSGLPFDILLMDILTTGHGHMDGWQAILTYRMEVIFILASNSELGGIDRQPMITFKLSADMPNRTSLL